MRTLVKLFSYIRISRAWAIRRVRDEFKAGAALQDAQKIQQQFNWANENLNIIKRQVILCYTDYTLHVGQRLIFFRTPYFSGKMHATFVVTNVQTADLIHLYFTRTL